MSQVATSNASACQLALGGLDRAGALGLVILFLVMDAGIKIAALSVVTESAVMIGWTGDAGFLASDGFVAARDHRSLCLAANRCARRDPAHRPIWAAQ